MIKELEYSHDNTKTKIYLLGTMHSSQKSIDGVINAINEYKPEVLAVELDQKRYDAMTMGKTEDPYTFKNIVLKGNYYYLLGYVFGDCQREVFKTKGFSSSNEFLTGITEAEKRGISVDLVDQDVDITMEKVWDSLSISTKVKIVTILAGTSTILKICRKSKVDLELDMKMPDDNINESDEQLRKSCPEMYTELVEKRNTYIADKVKELAKRDDVLVVVGAAHVRGIVNALKDSNIVDVTKTEVVTEKVKQKSNPCEKCGAEYIPNYKSMVHREVVKCECGEIRYFVCFQIGSSHSTCETKPCSKNDERIMKLIYGKQYALQ